MPQDGPTILHYLLDVISRLRALILWRDLVDLIRVSLLDIWHFLLPEDLQSRTHRLLLLSDSLLFLTRSISLLDAVITGEEVVALNLNLGVLKVADVIFMVHDIFALHLTVSAFHNRATFIIFHQAVQAVERVHELALIASGEAARAAFSLVVFHIGVRALKKNFLWHERVAVVRGLAEHMATV